MWLLISSGWLRVIAKEINHRGRGGHRELLFLCAVLSVLSVVSQNQNFRKILKSLCFMPRWSQRFETAHSTVKSKGHNDFGKKSDSIPF